MVLISMKENLAKNILILVIAICFWPILSSSLSQIQNDQTNDFLLIISVLLVTVCFANFAFTYEESDLRTTGGKLLSHSATFSFMLLIALLLESIVLATKSVYPSFYNIIFGFAILLYIGIILYDIWDYMRARPQ